MSFFTPNVANDAALNVTELYATVTRITSNYTVSGSDVNTLVMVDSASNVTVTLPATFPVGAVVTFLQYNTGTLALAAGSGASLPQAPASSSSRYQFISAMVVANVGGSAAVWIVSGV